MSFVARKHGPGTVAARSLLWAALAILLGVLLSGDWTRAADLAIAGLLHDESGRPLGSPVMVMASRDLTALGSLAVLGLLTALAVGFLLFLRRARDAAWAAALLLGAWPIVFALKALWGRPRPLLYEPSAQTFSPSFPSGHAMLSLVVGVGLVQLAVPPGHALRRPALFVALAVSFCVGLTRVHLGVHYPSDVLAGWLFGAAWLLILSALRAGTASHLRAPPAGGPRGPLGSERQAL